MSVADPARTCASGEIGMEIDGISVHLKTGDPPVQRGTVPCVIAFAMIGAESVSVGGKVLKTYEGD